MVSAVQAPEMDPTTFTIELDRLSQAAAALDKHPEQIPLLRRSLPEFWQVRDGEQRFEVPAGWLDSALQTIETNPVVRTSLVKDIQQRLAALRREAEAFTRPGPGANPDEARARVDEILRRREFRTVRTPGWWDRLRERVGAWLVKVLRRLFGRINLRSPSREFVVWGLIAVVFALLAFALSRRMLRQADTSSLELQGAPPLGPTWRDWAKRALAAATRGDYRAAVHAAYWAGVYRLEDLGVWQLDRARTPREYLRMLKSESASAGVSPQHGVALAALTQRLETTWYGYRPATSQDFHEAVSQLEALGCRFPSNLPTASS